MNILHYNLGLPPYRTGGLTKYSIDLMISQKRASNNVTLLYPGRHHLIKQTSIKKNNEYIGISVYEIINPLPVPLLGGIKEVNKFITASAKKPYKDFLEFLKPDVIHLHTLMGVHKEFLETAKELGIRIVMTTHDYFGICPKVNLMDCTGNQCVDYENGKMCISCNQHGYSMLKIFIMQSKTYRVLKYNSIVKKIRKFESKKQRAAVDEPIIRRSETHHLSEEYASLRKYYISMLNLVNVFHYNSTIAQQEYEKYVRAFGEVISISHLDIKDNRVVKSYENNSQPLSLTYLGPITAYKGFYLLFEALNTLIQRQDWHLHVFGDHPPEVISFDPEHFTFYGKYQYKDLKDIFDHTDLLIVPSIWKETFGFIGLEALSFGVPTMVSEHVGFKDMIVDGETGIIFKPEQYQITELITRILNNRIWLEQINRNIVLAEIEFTMEQHEEKIKELYTKKKDE